MHNNMLYLYFCEFKAPKWSYYEFGVSFLKKLIWLLEEENKLLYREWFYMCPKKFWFFYEWWLKAMVYVPKV